MRLCGYSDLDQIQSIEKCESSTHYKTDRKISAIAAGSAANGKIGNSRLFVLWGLPGRRYFDSFDHNGGRFQAKMILYSSMLRLTSLCTDFFIMAWKSRDFKITLKSLFGMKEAAVFP